MITVRDPGGGINNVLNGSVCDGSLGECNNVDYIKWLQEASIKDGLKNLSALLADPDAGPATVLGYSRVRSSRRVG